jgi:hypothetical protein
VAADIASAARNQNRHAIPSFALKAALTLGLVRCPPQAVKAPQGERRAQNIYLKLDCFKTKTGFLQRGRSREGKGVAF